MQFRFFFWVWPKCSSVASFKAVVSWLPQTCIVSVLSASALEENILWLNVDTCICHQQWYKWSKPHCAFPTFILFPKRALQMNLSCFCRCICQVSLEGKHNSPALQDIWFRHFWKSVPCTINVTILSNQKPASSTNSKTISMVQAR